MNRTYEEWIKYYENATKEQVIEDMMLDIKELKHNRDKAIEKLYCWGEVLDSEFQKEMLDILKGDNDE